LDSVSIGDFREKMADYIEQVRFSRRPLVITRYGKPLVKIIPAPAKPKADPKASEEPVAPTPEQTLAKRGVLPPAPPAPKPTKP
jgi:prevent-host-death family protein